MARLPDRSSRFMLIATFIICSSTLFVDFRFDTFKPVQNFYNSSSIFIRVFSSEYIVRPLYRSLSSMRDTRRAKEENKNLKEELNKQLIENYIISNKEILNRNIFFDVTNLEKLDLKLILQRLWILMLINTDAAISIECFYCPKYQVILILLKS